MIVSIVNKSKNELPKYETLLSAGMDLRANLQESIIIKPLKVPGTSGVFWSV